MALWAVVFVLLSTSLLIAEATSSMTADDFLGEIFGDSLSNRMSKRGKNNEQAIGKDAKKSNAKTSRKQTLLEVGSVVKECLPRMLETVENGEVYDCHNTYAQIACIPGWDYNVFHDRCDYDECSCRGSKRTLWECQKCRKEYVCDKHHPVCNSACERGYEYNPRYDHCEYTHCGCRLFKKKDTCDYYCSKENRDLMKWFFSNHSEIRFDAGGHVHNNSMYMSKDGGSKRDNIVDKMMESLKKGLVDDDNDNDNEEDKDDDKKEKKLEMEEKQKRAEEKEDRRKKRDNKIANRILPGKNSSGGGGGNRKKLSCNCKVN